MHADGTVLGFCCGDVIIARGFGRNRKGRSCGNKADEQNRSTGFEDSRTRMSEK